VLCFSSLSIILTGNTFKMSKVHCTTKFSWEKGPMQLLSMPVSKTRSTHKFTRVATELALIHNCTIRALNSIYIQAPHVPISEYNNFLAYCQATYQGFDAHHNGRFFAEVECETSLMRNHVPGFDKFKAWGNWLASIAAKKNNFSPDMCTSMMDDFVPALQMHLASDIARLLSLSRFPALDIAAVWKLERERVVGDMSKTKLLPVFLLNHDEWFEGRTHAFPGMTGVSMRVLRDVCGRVNGEWWKFSTVGFGGRPRGVRFVGKERQAVI
jgi:hypothetical protein